MAKVKKEEEWVPLKDNKDVPAFRCATCTSNEKEIWISWKKAKKEKIQAQRQGKDGKEYDPELYVLICPHCNNILVKSISLKDGEINVNAIPEDAKEELEG